MQPGMGSSIARALVPALTLIPRAPAREAEALRTLACWAGRFTPHVCLADDALLLEIGRCLRLFGGLRALLATMQEAAQALDFTLAMAVAPTPLAAHWFARLETGDVCVTAQRLPAHLDRLPVGVLAGKAAEALQRFGIATLGGARALPHAPLARRIGAASLQQLAQAYGEAPDLRAEFVFPERFELSLQLPALVENAPALLFAARRLLSALAGWLAVRQLGLSGATLHLRHEPGAVSTTPLPLCFAEATADLARFERVLRERLERCELVAPVDSLCLEASQITPLHGQSRTLFNDTCAEQGSIGVLLERLLARLGETQVGRLSVRDDWRPECATVVAPLNAASPPAGDRANEGSVSPALPRPLWLLPVPEALREVDGRPYRRGPLNLLAGPERIEAGWWDGGEDAGADAATRGDVRRDYFVARAADERWLWIFRECRPPGGWFLHGFFS